MDKAIGYFRVVSVILSFFVILTLAGITFFLVQQGFHTQAQQRVCDEDTNHCEWEPVPDEYYFNILTLAGFIMLSMYILPMVLRPIDTLANFGKYLMGFISYMLMMPIFTTIFQIYAMCNLHDVSWGNRPSSTGNEAFSANKKTQEQAKGDYMLYRTNFTLMWLLANTVYYIVVTQLVKG